MREKLDTGVLTYGWDKSIIDAAFDLHLKEKIDAVKAVESQHCISKLLKLVKLRLSVIHRESFGLESECATFWESFWDVFSTINDDIAHNLEELENGIDICFLLFAIHF